MQLLTRIQFVLTRIQPLAANKNTVASSSDNNTVSSFQSTHEIMAYLFPWHPSTQKVLAPPPLLQCKQLDDGLHDGGSEELLSVLLLPKPLVLSLDEHGTGIFPGVNFRSYQGDRTASVEIKCTKREADNFAATLFRWSSDIYIQQNVWEWDKIQLRVGKRVNLRQLFGAKGNANPVVLVATDDLLKILGEDVETRKSRVQCNSDSDDSSPVQYSPTTERAVNPKIVVFCPGIRPSYHPRPVDSGYNQVKSPGYLTAKLEDFFEVRMPGRVMSLLPFPIAVMEHTGQNFFLSDVFKGCATYSFLVEAIHWNKFIEVAMPLFSKSVNNMQSMPEYYNQN